jgi:DNA mismatch repair protein MLH3
MLKAADEVENEPQPDVSGDALVRWKDPNSKKTYTVNSRTGVVLPTRSRVFTAHENPMETRKTPPRTSAAINTSLTSVGLPMTLSKRPSTLNGENSNDWLPGFLKEWNNPVFARQNQEPIPVACFDGPGVEAAEFENKRCMNSGTNDFDQAGIAGTRKLSKAALQKARVVKQVDRKFILCKAQEGEDEILVLVDQHAASERVILEGLLEELCMPADESGIGTTGSNVKAVLLEKPLRFRIPAAEFELFQQHRRHFADWGILYNLHQKDEELSASQVRPPKAEHTIIVKALPPGIAERCTLFPKLLIELLRSEIWTFSSSTKRPALNLSSDEKPVSMSSNKQETSHSWFTRIGSCPKGILDLLNSRACRSAIMFNDELSIEQCEDLLRRLSKCAFPFMCAHGRVSMVPLVEMGSVGKGQSSEIISPQRQDGNEGSNAFFEAFSRWRRVDGDVGRDEIVAD